ncbi:roadblock/LC7 domain-containing protein [Luteolibacter flavescens]|uniref:Roadblock/LC7 domain-containing protein n=1 Tax=Luteolibacter flavescens TaxID=1859460 RepID=A0ABT3FVW5_9BACT|nr:roadblock/LC7 domain-containing protein [Luteolibacter flavescens]MCW1887743.1 roadblock/LC7 domain-containing protein [Luteolibacter flavescens]
MDPLEPWIDASAVRRLAENLLADNGQPEVAASPDAGFGSDFVGFAEGAPRPAAALPVAPPPIPQAAPAPSVRAPSEEVFERQLEAPLPPSAESVPAEPLPPGRGPLLVRLARFRDALIRHTGARGVFILDREGKPVMEDPAYTRMHFLARSLAQAYRPVAGQAGNVHVKIGANDVLEVVPVETPFGWLVLGTVVPRPLTAVVVAEIAAALKQAATPEGA